MGMVRFVCLFLYPLSMGMIQAGTVLYVWPQIWCEYQYSDYTNIQYINGNDAGSELMGWYISTICLAIEMEGISPET